MRITQKRKIADNIDSCALKREISKTDNDLVHVYVHKVCVQQPLVLCGEIAPFNYADQSNSLSLLLPIWYRSIQTFPMQTSGNRDLD